MPPHALMNFRGFPPGCGDCVAHFWGWDAHEARLCRPDDVSGDRLDIMIKKKKRENMHTGRCGNTCRQKCCAKGCGKEVKICIEIQRMWSLKCTIIPVITGATGMVTRSLKKNLETVPWKHPIDSLQKTAILGTSHIIRKVLQCETWSLSGGDHHLFKRSTRQKSPVTRDIPIV